MRRGRNALTLENGPAQGVTRTFILGMEEVSRLLSVAACNSLILHLWKSDDFDGKMSDHLMFMQSLNQRVPGSSPGAPTIPVDMLALAPWSAEALVWR